MLVFLFFICQFSTRLTKGILLYSFSLCFNKVIYSAFIKELSLNC
ncbi:DUF2633 family protein [Bergeyella cardium]|uniref:DUF2633 family protein n=1 Tax=Bergeyella cardium TaxID=1585976 RepID=A0A6P1QTH7_9FLAO|nr:DUF2633 family protein [Bergeyella cardium]